jgi:hypothetical protein
VQVELRRIKIRQTALIVFAMVFAFLFYCSCVDKQGDSGSENSGSGSLQFGVVFHSIAGDQRSEAASVNCADEGISIIEAHVYDENTTLLKSGGPWRCDDGHGSISAVPAGDNRVVVVLGKDTEDNLLFRGENPMVDVVAGQIADAGTIDCYLFVPTLHLPGDGALTEADTCSFSWSAVAGAREYVLKVLENDDSTVPFIDETISATVYKPSRLFKGKTYYWQVVARDSHGNESFGSSVRSVKVLGVLPIVPIITSILKNSQETD